MPKWLRQLIVFGAPLLVGLVNLAHPVHFEPTGVYHTIVDRVDWWIALHIINLMGFVLLGLAVFLLVQDRSGIAATISKVAIAIYVPFYTGFDVLIGIGTGTLVKQASRLTTDQFTLMEPMIDAFWSSGVAYAIAAIGSIAWTMAMLAAMVITTLPILFVGKPRVVGALLCWQEHCLAQPT